MTEIASCQRCGKTGRKQKLHQVHELFATRLLCKECYIKYHRSQWGFW